MAKPCPLMPNNSDQYSLTDMKKQINWSLYGAALSVNLISLVAGAVYSWTSPVLPRLNGNEDTEDNPFGRPITPLEESWIASLISLGASVGPFIGGAVVDKIGRKKTLLIAAIPIIISHLILAFTDIISLYYFSRIFAGLGVGCVYSLVPIYIGEIAEDSNRGALGCIMLILCTLGTLFCLTIGPYISIRTLSLGFLISPVAFVFCFGLFCPETPYYWLMINDEEEAKKSLKRLRVGSVDKDLEEMKKNVEKSKLQRSSFVSMLKSKAIARGFFIGCGLMFFQQFSGIAAIVSYMQSIFDASGNEIPPEVCAMIIGAMQVAVNVIASQLVDKLGRRFLMLFSFVGLCLAHSLLGLYFYLKVNHHDDLVACLFWLPVASLVFFTITYNIGIGPVPWAMIGELFPPHARSAASTVTCFVCLFLAFVLTVFFPNVVLVIGMAWSFWLFAGFSVGGAVFVWLAVPETKGKSLSEIQKVLEGGK